MKFPNQTPYSNVDFLEKKIRISIAFRLLGTLNGLISNPKLNVYRAFKEWYGSIGSGNGAKYSWHHIITFNNENSKIALVTMDWDI